MATRAGWLPARSARTGRRPELELCTGFEVGRFYGVPHAFRVEIMPDPHCRRGSRAGGIRGLAEAIRPCLQCARARRRRSASSLPRDLSGEPTAMARPLSSDRGSWDNALLHGCPLRRLGGEQDRLGQCSPNPPDLHSAARPDRECGHRDGPLSRRLLSYRQESDDGYLILETGVCRRARFSGFPAGTRPVEAMDYRARQGEGRQDRPDR